MSKLDELIRVYSRNSREIEETGTQIIVNKDVRRVHVEVNPHYLLKEIHIPPEGFVVDYEGTEKIMVEMAKRDIKRHFQQLVLDDIRENMVGAQVPVFGNYPVLPFAGMQFVLAPFEYIERMMMEAHPSDPYVGTTTVTPKEEDEEDGN